LILESTYSIESSKQRSDSRDSWYAMGYARLN
jgi:hypothetical protein